MTSRTRTVSLADLSVLLVIALAPIMFYAPIGRDVNVSLADMLIPFTLAWVLMHRSATWSPRPIVLAWGWLFLALISLSGLLGALTQTAFGHASFLGAFGKLAVGLAYALVAAHWASGPGRLQLAVNTWVLTASILSIATIIAAATGLPVARLYGGTGSGRYSGSFEDPNLFGAYLALSMGLCLSVGGRRKALAVTASLTVMPIAIVLTGSRGAFLAAVLPFALILLNTLVRNALVPILAIVSALGIHFTVGSSGWRALLAPSFERATGINSGTAGDRVYIWGYAVEVWSAHPLLGVGPGQFVLKSGELYHSADGAVAHNTIIGLLAETGLIGLLVYVSLPAIGVLLLLRHAIPGVSFGLVLGAGSLFISMMSLSLENARFGWLLMGLILAGSAPYLAPTLGSSRALRSSLK